MNIELILRMHAHGYTAEAIHLRLRYGVELIKMIIKNHEGHIKNKSP